MGYATRQRMSGGVHCVPSIHSVDTGGFMVVEPSRYTTNGQRASRGNVVSRLVGSKTSPSPQQAAMGFFTDTSLCIGCKACEVACKQWNQLPAKEPGWTGASYDNTGQLSATTWRHVQFIEQIGRRDNGQNGQHGLRSDMQTHIAQARSEGP